MEWIWLAISWFLLNVVIKLFVNSIERIIKDKIDEKVKQIPITTRTVVVELMRYLFVVILLPIVIVSKLFHNPSRFGFIREFQSTINFILSKKRFHRVSPIMFYSVTHPQVLFSKKKQREVFEMWQNRVFSDPKLFEQYKE